MKKNGDRKLERAATTLKPVTRRLLLPLAILVAFLVGGATWLLLHAYDAKLRAVSLAIEQGTVGDLHIHLVKHTRALQAVQDLLLTNTELKAALDEGDRERLLEIATPIFEQLKSSFAVTHFNFAGPDRVCLLRVHKPEFHGDRFDRFTALEAGHTGQSSAGIEFGAVGTLVLRVVQPVFENGRLIGYMELGKEIEDILESLAEFEGVEKILVVNKSLLEKSRWEAGLASIGREAGWDRLPGHVILYSSIPLPAEAEPFIGCADHEHWDAADEIRFAGKYWRVMARPVPDASGRIIGELLLLHDVTRLKTAQHRQIIGAAVFAFVLLTSLQGMIVMMLRRTDSGILAQQADLREERGRIAHILAITGTGIDIVDKDFNLRFVDGAWQKVYGDPAGRKCHEYFKDLDTPCPKCGVPEALKSKQVVVTEKLLPKENNKIVEVHTVPFQDATGEWLAAEFKVDITGRKKDEAALRESKEHLTATLRSIGDGVIVCDNEGRVATLNPVAEVLTGWETADATGRPVEEIFQIVSAETRETARNPVKRALAEGAIVGLANHTVLIARDGSEYQIADSCAPITDSSDCVIGAVLVFRDVTEEYQRREELQESEERFQKMLSLVPDMISIHDPDMNIIYSNWNGFAAVPREKRQVNSKCYRTYRGFDRICPDCKAGTVIQTKEAFRKEEKLPDGTWIDLHVIPILGHDGSVKLFVEWVRDITERKAAEEREHFDNKFHVLVADASARFVEVCDIRTYNEAVEAVLASLGELFGMDRSYLFRFSGDLSTMDNTHEWCAPGIETHIARIQQIPTASMPWWMANMREMHPVHIPEVARLPDVAEAEKREFQSQDIQSLVCLPICDDHKNLLGFLGLDSVRAPHTWPDEHIAMLQVIAEIIGSALVRMETVRALVESEAQVRRKLEIILDPEGDMGELSLTDLIDPEALQSMMDDFYRFTRIGSAVVDMTGKVLVAVGWQDICTKYHRVHPETQKNCEESDVLLSSGMLPGEFKAYRCKNNMWDMATPIVVGGRHLGNMFLGQFCYEDEEIDLDLFRRQARQYGFPEEDYLAALQRVPRWSRDTVEAVMAFYAKLAGMISSQGYGMIKLSRTLAQKEKALAEQQQAEQDLRERENKFRSMFESMTEIVVLHELVFGEDGKPLDYRILDCNPAFTQSTGITLVEAQGRLATEVYRADHAPYLEEYAHVAMTGNPHSFTTYYPPLDRHFEINVASPGRNLFFTVSADVTERKKAEEALIKTKAIAEENETRFRALHNASFGGIAIHDKGIILDCNQGLSEISGYSQKELIGMNGLLLVSEKTRERVIHNIATHYEKPYEAIGVRKNGEEYPIRLEAREIPYKGRQVRTVEFRDITEQKKAAEELQQLRNYLANIIDSMPSIVVGVDCTGHVTQWNAKAREATGIAPEEAQGLPFADLLPHFANQMERIREAMRKREVETETRHIRHEGDAIRYEDITIYPLIANGVEGAVIRIDDVTDRVRIEEMMVQSEKMLSVGGLAAGMAHEINNPLAGMMQTAQVLSDRLTGDLPANEQAAGKAGTSMAAIRAYMEARGVPRMIRSISETGARAAKIVSNMLGFARKGDMSFSGQDMIELIDQTLELAASDYDLKKQYDFRRIEIVREYEENIPCVPCESGKIQQVLLNLLRNGAEAMQDGKGHDETRRDKPPRFILRVAHEEAANMVRIEVEDNGPGMDEATCRRLFEPFFTTKPVGQGTGLGLSVSYFIVTEIHKGELTVESKPGQGANFIIRLPAQRA